MKPAKFDYCRPRDVDEAARALAEGGEDAVVIAGGQSLGPMLNLRLVAPRLLVDLSRLDELRHSASGRDELVLGAAVTHAEVEDGAGGEASAGLLPRAAGGIAYRPVRNRGTVGGSLAHADPAGDWAPVMLALGAAVAIRAPGGARRLPMCELILSPLMTALGHGEVIVALHVPRLGAGARWGHCKFCRKPGDFAESLAVVVVDVERSLARAVLGSRTGVPAHLPAVEASLQPKNGRRASDGPALRAALESDLAHRGALEHWTDYDCSLHRATAMRALREAVSG